MGVKVENVGKIYKKVPPEGGWGYIVGGAVSLMFMVTIVPTTVFGMVYGEFLAGLGDETGATTLINGVFNTVLCFTGLPVNHLLQKYTYRKVGLMGAGIYFIGTLGNVFVTNLSQMLLSFGVFQGLGFGLMMPAVFSAFNSYFDKRQNVVMGACQALIVVVSIGWPILTKMMMEEYGFRGTAAIFSALSLHGFVAMMVLQPVSWHMKKEVVDPIEMNEEELTAENRLMDEGHNKNENRKGKRPSVASLNGYACSLQNVNRESQTDEDLGIWKRISKSLDLELFKESRYVNIAFGLSLGMTSDLAFISIYPLLLISYGFNHSEVTTLFTIYFTADLVSRIALSVVSGVFKIWNRYVFLLGALLSAIFRVVFVLNNSFIWIATTTAILGFLRCFIQTPLPLVVAEQYGARFPTAFSLYMVVCGVVALAVGVLSGVIKNLTQSNTMVVHLLTVVYLFCAIPWIIEIIITKLKKKNDL
ncbi:monocarboxylate transporter 1 [Onthophagus taurus]|uniref:monocarboxylate transporter 1 n=1 Tax=Onthophagus taurus TaxID=166361 RepID=UPI0039BE967C